jgi:hypothetical protein
MKSLEDDLRDVFELHGYLWFSHEIVAEADGLICKCYVVKEWEDG